MLRILNACLFIFLFVSRAAAGEPILGEVRVIDADTFVVGTVKVRLFGIDAQEKRQSCELADGRIWACGEWASKQVSLMYEGAWARCERSGTDKYRRAIAKCRIDGADVGERLVREGLAEAYRKYSLDYVDAEKRAVFEEIGLWRGRVQAPSEFRAAKAEAQSPPDPNCPIKGNISRNGIIFHLPGQDYYDVTWINPGKGERWFCSEAAARAAGWRKARR